MAKFNKRFYGVRHQEIYPTQFEPGDECPPELEEAARADGAIAASKKPAKEEVE